MFSVYEQKTTFPTVPRSCFRNITMPKYQESEKKRKKKITPRSCCYRYADFKPQFSYLQNHINIWIIYLILSCPKTFANY